MKATVIDLPDKQFFTPPEIASLLQVSRQTIYRWMGEGLLPHVTIGGTKRVHRLTLLSFVESDE